ncbi:homoserine dehydrogenase [Elstera cyanobacteriorum]|uniref:Homoserine dehydrogenase n=1 Tax=Elstera cyanobacteriorum TaxID=2022747 RepID=A0A255XXK7_9PROT|nr:homoserine dehydrogenase [Elstera cyanobacteriorum]OYQ20970.1 homoserine dehydrogenase [Elstera cyanobacteriorum]GFZ97843.1 homoserine dehydrogenase [Elstera cyanobacteriorum]
MEDRKPLRVGIAGLGVVGAGVVGVLQRNAKEIAARAGRPIEVVAVAARDRTRDRGVDLSQVSWADSAADLTGRNDIDVFVELIGGSEGVAREAVESALARSLPVVTANKALLAHHGAALARMAEAKGVTLAFEAAVAGGIPVIKVLREGLAANRFSRVYGILNGTCNYILTKMRQEGRDFTDVLTDAQKLGYAEADPTFDVDGIDAAHKLSILAAVAFGADVAFDKVHVEGIRHVSAVDITFAEELGYRIKLLGIAARTDAGLEQRVHPCMVPVDSAIASVEDVYNAVVAEGDAVGTSMLVGRGAGAGPTASAVVSDLIDLARGVTVPTFAVPVGDMEPIPSVSIDKHRGAYYVRLMVLDQPGVIADIAGALRDEKVSMEAMIQRGRNPGEIVPVVLTTHETDEAAMRRALARIDAIPAVTEPPRVIRIMEQL